MCAMRGCGTTVHVPVPPENKDEANPINFLIPQDDVNPYSHLDSRPNASFGFPRVRACEERWQGTFALTITGQRALTAAWSAGALRVK